MNKIAKYGSTAAAGAILFSQYNKGQALLKTPLGNVPVPLAGAAISVAASILADAMHSWILPEIQDDKRLMQWESALLVPGFGGLGFVTAAYVSNPRIFDSSAEVRNLFILGALSEVIGQYVYQSFLVPMLEPQQ